MQKVRLNTPYGYKGTLATIFWVEDNLIPDKIGTLENK